MTATWVRRDFAAAGVTQSPPGGYLAKLQEPYFGKVLLCIDVSGSMSGRLHHAVAGARQFAQDAVAANYLVGLVLWAHGVSRYVPLSRSPEEVERTLRSAAIAGGTDVTPTLELGIRELGGLSGDRVMAIFGDGDIGPVPIAVDAARRAAALGIRIIVRGLGEYATGQLNQIATDAGEATVVRSAGDIETGIVSMVTSMRRRP
jgi:Mg-chelatase subunit ChlD